MPDALGLDCVEVPDRLLARKVAATPMLGWEGKSPVATPASCSATSPLSGWHCLASGCQRHSRKPASTPKAYATVERR